MFMEKVKSEKFATCEIKIIRSKRKTISVTVKNDASVEIHAPLQATQREILQFAEKYKAWITEKQLIAREKLKSSYVPDEKEIKLAMKVAKAYLEERVAFFAAQMKLEPQKIKITSAKKRFGSCSSKKTVCFSLYLMFYYPDDVDYIIVHELSHLKEMNHSRRFYAIVEKYLPNYKERRASLNSGMRDMLGYYAEKVGLNAK